MRPPAWRPPSRRSAPFLPALQALCLLCLLCLTAGLGAQEDWEGSLSQIPRQLFVGDQGRLTLNLGSLFPETASFSVSDPWILPQSPELRLHRLEFDALRGQLSIDFTAFAPGELELPPIRAPQLPGFSLEGCRVSVASVLALEGPLSSQGILILSGPAPPLAAPGTALLIYGSSSLLILLLLLLLGAGIWGRPWLGKLLEARRRRRLIRLMGKIGEGLRERIPGASSREILRKLSLEFRAFLAYFFNNAPDNRDLPVTADIKSSMGQGRPDCRALTAEEFGSLPPLFPPVEGKPAVGASPASLGSFFRRLDRLRFSGEGVGDTEIAVLLDQMEGILRAMERGFRERGRS
jgi:hypothetical protein